MFGYMHATELPKSTKPVASKPENNDKPSRFDNAVAWIVDFVVWTVDRSLIALIFSWDILWIISSISFIVAGLYYGLK